MEVEKKTTLGPFANHLMSQSLKMYDKMNVSVALSYNHCSINLYSYFQDPWHDAKITYARQCHQLRV